MQTRIFTLPNHGAHDPGRLLWNGDINPLPQRGDMVNIGAPAAAPDLRTIVSVCRDLRDNSADLYVPFEVSHE